MLAMWHTHNIFMAFISLFAQRMSGGNGGQISMGKPFS